MKYFAKKIFKYLHINSLFVTFLLLLCSYLSPVCTYSQESNTGGQVFTQQYNAEFLDVQNREVETQSLTIKVFMPEEIKKGETVPVEIQILPFDCENKERAKELLESYGNLNAFRPPHIKLGDAYHRSWVTEPSVIVYTDKGVITPLEQNIKWKAYFPYTNVTKKDGWQDVTPSEDKKAIYKRIEKLSIDKSGNILYDELISYLRDLGQLIMTTTDPYSELDKIYDIYKYPITGPMTVWNNAVGYAFELIKSSSASARSLIIPVKFNKTGITDLNVHIMTYLELWGVQNDRAKRVAKANINKSFTLKIDVKENENIQILSGINQTSKKERKVPQNGLVAYYPFNGNANDESGNNYDGKVYGATPAKDRYGNVSSAYKFDGVNDRIVIPRHDYTFTKSRSFNFWFRTEKLNQDGYFLHAFETTSVTSFAFIFYSKNKKNAIKFNYGVENGHYDWFGFSNSENISPNKWYMLTAVFEAGKGCTIFLNGEQRAKNTFLTKYARRPQGRGPITVGSFGTAWYLNMVMDELSIWDITLTHDEILYLYNNKPGKERVVSSISNCESPITYAGKTYNTVQIGNQCWFKENLDVGIMIDGKLDQTNNNRIEKYCYNNNPDNCKKYGGLYQWREAMQHVKTEGAQGICPEGWHLPRLDEYEILEDYVNDEAAQLVREDQPATKYTPTDETGLSALFAGYRHYNNDDFSNSGYYTSFWSSTDSSGTYAHYMHLYSNYSFVHLTRNYEDYGFSVRCIKD